MSFVENVNRIEKNIGDRLLQKGEDYVEGKAGVPKEDYHPSDREHPEAKGDNFGQKGQDAFEGMADKVIDRKEDYIGGTFGQMGVKPTQQVGQNSDMYDFGARGQDFSANQH